MIREKAHVQDSAVEAGSQKPVEVHNRDILLLADVLYIMQEVCRTEQRRDWQRDRMYNITQHLTGMPGSGSLPKGFDDAFAMLSEIDEEHENLCKGYVRKLRKAQRILNGIESQSMRTFVLMKYILDVPDADIQRELNLTRRGFERARNCVEKAPDMASVRWQERYILVQKSQK